MPSDAYAPVFYEFPRRSTRNAGRIGAWLAACALASSALVLTGCGTNISTEVTSTTGTISASTATLDAGSAVIGSPTAGVSVSFTNNGAKDVAFTASPLAGGEFQIVSTTCGSSLAAGKSCSVTVNFTPTAAGARSSSLAVSSGSQSTAVSLRGTGLRPAALTASVATLAFADTLLNTASPVQQITYTNGGDVAASVVLNLQGNFQQSSSTCAQAIAPQGSCYVTIAFLPTSRGAAKGSLTAAMGSALQTTALSGNGVTPAHVTVSPAALEFPDTPMQTASVSSVVQITNDGDMDSPLSAVTASQDFVVTSSICSRTLSGHSQCTFQLAFKPSSAGFKSGTVTLAAGASNFSIPLTGTGYVPAQLAFTPSSLTFASTQVGSASATQRIVLSNSGGRAASVQIGVTQPDFLSGQTDCTGSLAAHAQCSIAVTFAPASTGSKSGTVTVNSDAGRLTALLAGAATGASRVTMSPASASFPDVAAGQASAAMPFVLTNTGDVAAGMGAVQVSDNFAVGTNGCGASIAGHASCTVTLLFQPAAAGSKIGTLTIQAGNDTVQSTLSGNATAPLRQVALQAANPATINAGASATVHLTGTNLDLIDSLLVDGTSTAFAHISAKEITFIASPSVWASQAMSLVVHAPSVGNSNAVALQIAAAPVSYDAAVRFTQQAAMSTTPDQIAQVQARGLSQWIDWQMGTAMYPYQNNYADMLYATYFNNAQNSTYALRQRVTLALKLVFTYGMGDACFRTQCGHFWEARLQQDAFGNVRTLLYDVATSPLMGTFLQNANNFSEYPWTGTSRANANFARELMQLMTIGPYKLNRDGSQVLDSNGQPLASYSEANVLEAAAAMSGWTWGDIGIYGQLLDGNPLLPMQVIESKHSPLAKNILPGLTVPAGQTGTKDMNDVLDALFQHPNIAPFLCRRLIQHLVTSNPSPAYITRVVTVFEDNGQGVRGDLTAIVKAILLDPEARRGDDPTGAYTQTETHFVEPLLFIANAATAAGVGFSDDEIQNVTNALGEDPFMSKTVFGAYSPENKLPTGQYAPEVQLLNDAASLQKVSFVNGVAHGTQPGISGSINTSPFWSAASPAALLDQMNHFLFHGTMPASLRTALNAYISDHASSTANQMLPDMLVIALNSSAYQVMH